MSPQDFDTLDTENGLKSRYHNADASRSGPDASANANLLLISAQNDDDSSGDEQDRLLGDNAQSQQQGVRTMEAITSVWTKTALIAAYAMIWVIYFADSLQQATTGNLTPYVTSAFKQHSLTPTVSITSNIVGGVFKLTLAKVLDVFGRPQGYLLSIILTTLGLVMMAVCRNVETYAAAQVFYWVGFNGLGYCLSIFVADTSSLQNRGLMLAFTTSPYIITTWIAGPLAQGFLEGPGFRWGFGIFALLTPCVTLPLYVLFMKNYRKAKQRGLISPRKTALTFWQTLVHYAREFDVIGLVLVSVGLALFLLPFNIHTRQVDGWRSPLIISSLVMGPLLLCAFAIWETFYAPVQFLPYALLTDRTVVGACALAAVSFIGFYVWNSYFRSFLQVVNGLSVAQASYVGSIYSIGSCFSAIFVGLLIRKTGRYKALSLYFGVPATVFGVWSMRSALQPEAQIGYTVMCQVLIACAGGALVITQQTAAMAAASHQYLAVVLAVDSLFSAIGAAIGLTVSATIWQAVFPQKLKEYLPESARGNFTAIYGQLDVQLSYPLGSPTRVAIQRAYGDGQRAMLAVSTAVLLLSFVAVGLWRDVNIKNVKQVRGNVM
ncbi:related to major facilitator MirA [Claviceps purpurea 20.1]|uniref:Related to major facilitator MirA n=1 Tax=Claviceps purpurea (strain 20.1) TaxID=1111077 RepID=M1W9X3_CLAP2|nr:hypothetical protein E4U50_002996 [Claviceps purpurea]CCE27384.1 related to major facilitator MirA [Claviceps purpurea 20.1]